MAVTDNTWASLSSIKGNVDLSPDEDQKLYLEGEETAMFGSSPYRSMAEYLSGRKSIKDDRSALGKANFHQRLQWTADTHQGIGDFAANIRADDNWQFYAFVNAGYGQMANHEVFKQVLKEMKLDQHGYGTQSGLGYVLARMVGASGIGGGLMAEAQALGNKIAKTKTGKVLAGLLTGETTDDQILANFKDADSLINAGESMLEGIFSDASHLEDTVNKKINSIASFLSGKFKEIFDKSVDAASQIGAAIEEGFSITGFANLGKKVLDEMIQHTGSMLTNAVSLFRRVFDINAHDVANKSPTAMYKSYVMNTPPTASFVIDPMHRLYNNHVIATTHVLNIIPGNLWYGGFKAREAKASSYQLEKELEAFEKGDTGMFVFDTDSAIYKMIKYSADHNKRLGWFEPTPMKYQMVYSSLMAKVLARISNKPAVTMVIDDLMKDGDGLGELNMGGWGHLAIALGPNCTITENASNNFEGGMLESTVEGLKSQIGEKFNQFSSMIGTAFSDKWKKRASRMFGADSPIAAVVGNSTMHWPKFWNSSDMSRSYTLSFRLESPYGNYQSLIEYVYKPFLALLACSLPIQTSFYGATTPFVIRCDCPGMFSISEGYVSSLDFRRAPDQNTYTANGLASAIEVNMSITDIDPYLALPTGPAGYAANINMAAWLDSLCGVGYQEIYSGGSMSAKLKTMAQFSKMMPSAVKNSIENMASKASWSMTTLGPVR